jgi:glycosyltransferase involved in cell wall biosynthesis
MISVVIPAYNEEKLIKSCLSSLTRQITKRKFEVIVVDNNSTDKTVQIANNFKKQLNLQIVRCKKQGRGAARAEGFKKSQGEIIFSTDCDTQVPTYWLESMSKYLDKNFVAVSGPNRISDCSFMTNFFYNNLQPVFYFIYNLIFENSTLNGFNFCVKRQAYLKSGGFNRSLNAQEDLDLGFKLSKVGRIKLCSNLYVFSSGRRFKNGLIKGLISPIKTFIKYKHKKNNHVSLENIRN